jgi:hypothetical protein
MQNANYAWQPFKAQDHTPVIAPGLASNACADPDVMVQT